MSLFQELERWNVFRVGMTDAVAAWIVPQINDPAGAYLGAPFRSGKFLFSGASPDCARADTGT